MKVAELEGLPLAMWMARATKAKEAPRGVTFITDDDAEWCEVMGYRPDLDWSIAGPLHDKFKVGIERTVQGNDTRVYAYVPNDPLGGFYGGTALIAGARAIVASVYGAEVPDSPHQETP